MPVRDVRHAHEAKSHRVRRTFAFIDLSDSTAYGVSRGDDRFVEQLSLFRAAVRSVASATGVRVAKWLGDGAMLVGLDPADVVAAVLRIMRHLEAGGAELTVHAGVAAGDVILFEGDDHIGQVVNLAARLAELAEGGQILAPVDMLPGVGRSHAVLGPVTIQGFEESLVVADLATVPALIESLML